jgi:hypothetical protein
VAGDSTFWHGFLIAPMNPLERQLPPGGAPHSARHRVRPPSAICWRQKMLCISLSSVPRPIVLASANPDEARSYKSAVPIDV